MKRFAPHLPLLALFAFVGWTSTSQSEWFKGIIYAGSGKIQLTDATGNLVSAGNFTNGGNVAIAGTLAVTGATTLRSTLAVTGTQTNAGALNVTGALGVTGATTLRNTLSVANSTTLSGALLGTSAGFSGQIDGGANVNVAGALAVTGTTTLRGQTTTSHGTIAFTAATGSNKLSLTDNLANALDVTEAGNSYLNFITTDSGERVVITKLARYNNVTNSITAFATGGQASATQLSAGINRVTTVGTAGDSVKLPTAEVGLLVVVSNAAAANSMNLFPASGASINNGASNAALAVAAGKSVTCWGVTSTIWACSGP